MVPPSEIPIGASDRGRVGFGLDAQNGVQGRQWTILRSQGFDSSDGVEKSARIERGRKNARLRVAADGTEAV
jgi:hypothetical protein